MSHILAIDTCTELCSAALLSDGAITAKAEIAPREHSQKLLPMVETLLADANVTMSELDAIAFGRGPGSFTGVRIGTATAQGLALGSGKPLIPVSTLAAMALQAAKLYGDGIVISAIDARMGEVYLAAYRCEQGRLSTIIDEQVCKPDEWDHSSLVAEDSLILVGTAWEAYPQMVELFSKKSLQVQSQFFPRAEEMAELAVLAYQQGKGCDAAEAEPVYLRDKVTWKKLPGRE